MLRNATDFLDEESIVNFFIAALGSVPHQYIYTSMGRKIVQDRFASLHELVSNPLPVVPPAKVPPIVPPALIEFVGQYVSNIDRPELVSNTLPAVPPARVPHIVPPALIEFGDWYVSHDRPEVPNRAPAEPLIANAGISARAEAFDRTRLEDHECDEDDGSRGIVQEIQWLSGHMAVLHYFCATIDTNTKQDILWPVWCGKLQLHETNEQKPRAATSMIATPIWYPSLIRRCRHAFVNEYHARTMLHGFDVMRRFEQGFKFVLATVTGFSALDCEELRWVDGRRINRFEGEDANALYRMAVVSPLRAQHLLHRLATLREGAATNRIENADLPIAQYERIVRAEGGGSSQLFCLWEDGERDVASTRISCQEFTDEVVEFLTTRKSLRLLSTFPEYWHAGEWAEPPTMIWRHS
jgi:hypothetical protein